MRKEPLKRGKQIIFIRNKFLVLSHKTLHIGAQNGSGTKQHFSRLPSKKMVLGLTFYQSLHYKTKSELKQKLVCIPFYHFLSSVWMMFVQKPYKYEYSCISKCLFMLICFPSTVFAHTLVSINLSAYLKKEGKKKREKHKKSKPLERENRFHS